MRDYNILSLDGGGIRGLILLKQLIELENILETPLHEHFDLISGTSTGGIVAIMLSLGYTTNDILLLYTKHGKYIFKKNIFRLGIFRPKFNDKYFNNLLKEYVGDKKLSDIKKDLLIVSYNATLKDKKIFKSSKAKINTEHDYNLYDVIRSTTAAPTKFKPHQINNDNYYIDGGLVINNPAMISWVEALNNEKKHNNINIISFSTGANETPIKKKTIKGGILNWASPTVNILLTEQTQTTDYHMNKLYTRESGIYVRCNSIIQNSNSKIDDVTEKNIKNLLLDGEISAKQNMKYMKYFVSKS